MYANSNTRRFTVALVMVATFAGLLSASVASAPAGAMPALSGASIGALPVLPEIIVTATRLGPKG